jgi:hypothetical protein
MISLHFSRLHFHQIIFGLTILSSAAMATEPPADLQPLLFRMEQQIAAGHATAPPDDNAVATWRQVVELGSGGIDSPATHGTLAAFANHLRTRAVDEMAAGRRKLADDLAIFAVQASRLAWQVPFREPPVSAPASAAISQMTEPPEQPQLAEPSPTDVAALEPAISTEILVEHAKPVTPEKRRHLVRHDPTQKRVVQLEVSTAPPPAPTPNFFQRIFINIGGLFHRAPHSDNLKSFY